MPLLTRILKPEEFNAVTLAELEYRPVSGSSGLLGRPPSFSELPEDLRRARIDDMQRVLDSLKAQGIIG